MELNTAASSPPSDNASVESQKSVDIASNNNESNSESHTPPLPEKPKSPQPVKKRKSRFNTVDGENKGEQEEVKPTEKIKSDEKQNPKKSNEWDMFAEADNIGDFNVSSKLNLLPKCYSISMPLIVFDKTILNHDFRVPQ